MADKAEVLRFNLHYVWNIKDGRCYVTPGIIYDDYQIQVMFRPKVALAADEPIPLALPSDSGQDANPDKQNDDRKILPIPEEEPQDIPPVGLDRAAEAASRFERVVAALAEREQALRRALAAECGHAMQALLRSTTANVSTLNAVNDALVRFGLTLSRDQQPVRLRLGEAGGWVLEASPGGQVVSRVDTGHELLPLVVVPLTSVGPWLEREEARRAGKRSAGGLYNPLVVSAAGVKAELAERATEPLRERLRAMPHDDLEDRKKLARWLNQEMRRLGLAIRCPATGEPGVLRVGSARAGTSRFIVEHSVKGKQHRSFSTQEFEQLLDRLTFVPAVPGKGQLWRGAGDPDEQSQSLI